MFHWLERLPLQGLGKQRSKGASEETALRNDNDGSGGSGLSSFVLVAAPVDRQSHREVKWKMTAAPMAGQFQWFLRTPFTPPPLPPWGREGSGAGHEIPVALLSRGIGQRPAVLITTLVFVAGLGPASCFGQHIPKRLCNFTLDRGFLLFTVYWQSVKCFIRQMLPSAQLCSVVAASEDVSVGTLTRVTSGLKACL